MSGLIAINIPKWGIEMEHGTISEWRVALGDTVSVGDELVDIETDKIVNSFEATHAGTLVRTLADAGEELPVGALIGVLATGDVSEEEIDAFVRDRRGGEPADSPAAAGVEKPTADATAAAQAADRSIRISPALRRKAERLGLDPADIPGTGEGGRILRDDIETARAQAPDADLKPLTGSQKTVAERMTRAVQTIPHFTLRRACRVDGVLNALAVLGEQAGTRLSPTHAIIQAVARALVAFPEFNINYLPGGVRRLESIDVGLAVDTGDSLLTPVLRDLADANIETIAVAAAELVERTRGKGLNVADLEGGAITVSNLGMLGVDGFDAIINPPQVMILAVGTVQERPVFRDGEVEPARFCEFSLSCDHRVINGADGARFLATVCETLESHG